MTRFLSIWCATMMASTQLSAEQKKQLRPVPNAVEEAMAAMTVNKSLWESAARALGAAYRFELSQDRDSSQKLCADIQLLSSVCGRYRSVVKDAGWKAVEPSYNAILLYILSSIKKAGTDLSPHNISESPLHCIELCIKDSKLSHSRSR